MIPFSSDIKFNLIIRDLKPDNKYPTLYNESYCVYLKGAPERVINRCGYYLVDSERVEKIDKYLPGINAANEKFGKMGERVIAFARKRLDPNFYKKVPAYPFDVKNWKSWREVREYDYKT